MGEYKNLLLLQQLMYCKRFQYKLCFFFVFLSWGGDEKFMYRLCIQRLNEKNRWGLYWLLCSSSLQYFQKELPWNCFSSFWVLVLIRWIVFFFWLALEPLIIPYKNPVSSSHYKVIFFCYKSLVSYVHTKKNEDFYQCHLSFETIENEIKFMMLFL